MSGASRPRPPAPCTSARWSPPLASYLDARAACRRAGWCAWRISTARAWCRGAPTQHAAHARAPSACTGTGRSSTRAPRSDALPSPRLSELQASGRDLRVQLLAARAPTRAATRAPAAPDPQRPGPTAHAIARAPRRSVALRGSHPGAAAASRSPSAATSSSGAATGPSPISSPWSSTMPCRASPTWCAAPTCSTARPGRSRCSAALALPTPRYAHVPAGHRAGRGEAREVPALGRAATPTGRRRSCWQALRLLRQDPPAELKACSRPATSSHWAMQPLGSGAPALACARCGQRLTAVRRVGLRRGRCNKVCPQRPGTTEGAYNPQ